MNAYLLRQVFCYVLLNATEYILSGSGNKLCTSDVFVELDITLADAVYYFGSHFGHLLIGCTVNLEAVVEQPFANELLRELFLRFTLEETLFVTFCVEIT